MLIQHKMLKKQDDKNCQITRRLVEFKLYTENKCQATKCYKEIDKNSSVMWPGKPQMNVHSKGPATQSSFKKKHVPLYKDKNCKTTIICEKKET